jgi:hypothetical protein
MAVTVTGIRLVSFKFTKVLLTLSLRPLTLAPLAGNRGWRTAVKGKQSDAGITYHRK